MAISGPQALRRLDRAIADIRQEEQNISRQLARANERIAKLKQTETSLVKEFAKLQLAGEQLKELNSRLTRSERKAHNILEKHDIQLKETQNQLEILDKKIAQLSQKRQEILAKIDDVQGKLDELGKKIIAKIANNNDYKAAKQRAQKLIEIANSSRKKADMAQKDKEEKGKPYRNDPLFIYLWERKYGTDEYRASNLIRWLDGKVARLIKYHKARPNFAMLNEIPLRLDEHAQRQEKLAQQAVEELEKIEQDEIDKAGGKPLRKALQDNMAKLSELDEQILKIEDERDKIAEKYQTLADGRSSQLAQATKMLTDNLMSQDIRIIFDRAKMTRIRDDDKIAQKIEEVRELIKEEEPDIKSYRERLRILQQRRRELEDIEWEFKKSRFDDPRSIFRENNLTGSLLADFLSGAISAAVYWQHWQNNQSWRKGAIDWSGSGGWSHKGKRASKSRSLSWDSFSSSSNPWGGAKSSSRSRRSTFSRPRSGSRGSRKHKGFKTGGGF